MLQKDGLFRRREEPARPASPVVTETPAVRTEAPKPADIKPEVASKGDERKEAKLIVGPDIKMKGVEVSDCDTLVVEGRVQATINCRVVQIAERGAFKGSAEIDLAEIRGEFDGDLTVRQKLVIYSSGKVTGKIRYGKLVIEEGGQLAGDLQVGGGHEQKDLLQKTA